MIVYNVKRQFFTMKNDAEAYRKEEGLKPAALATLEICGREDLAALLNALCGLESIAPVPEPEVIERAMVAPEVNDIPDYIPRFLLKDYNRRRRDD